jgi:hypothetical protein
MNLRFDYKKCLISLTQNENDYLRFQKFLKNKLVIYNHNISMFKLFKSNYGNKCVSSSYTEYDLLNKFIVSLELSRDFYMNQMILSKIDYFVFLMIIWNFTIICLNTI